MNIGRGLYNITAIGLAAMFWIVIMKLVFSKFQVPGVSELVALV